MPAARPLVLCLLVALAAPLARPAIVADARAQVPGVRCVTPVGTCVVPAIPIGAICFCGNFQGVVR